MTDDVYLDRKGRPMFCRIPLWVVKNVFPEMTPTAREVYVILVSYANFNQRTAFPSYRTISRDFRKSSKSTAKGIKELSEFGLISVTSFYSNRPPIYQLAEHPAQARTWAADRHGLVQSNHERISDPDKGQGYLFTDDLTGNAAAVEACRLLEICKVRKTVAAQILKTHRPESIVHACHNAAAKRDAEFVQGRRGFNTAGYIVAALGRSPGGIGKSRIRRDLERHKTTKKRKEKSCEKA